MVAQPEAGGGLANLGNTCFMNSVLQCLVHTQLLHRYLEKRQHSAKCRRRQGEFCLFCALEDLVQRTFAQGPRSPAFAPRAIANALPAIAKGFRLGRQEDAHEFLRYVLEKLTKEGSAVVEAARPPGVIGKYTALQSWFSGALRSQIQCCHCGHESNTQDPFLDLSLELRAVGGRVAPDLDGAMTQFCQEEFLDGANKYMCEACGKLRRARKQFLVERPPRHLSVHLKRFSFGEAGGGSGKISAHVAFPATWQLARYSAARTRLGAETPPLPYQLYAVVCHDGGSTHSGHYYCYVRAMGKPGNGAAGGGASGGAGGGGARWYLLNDSQVKLVREADVLRAPAYLLFYLLPQQHHEAAIAHWRDVVAAAAAASATHAAGPSSNGGGGGGGGVATASGARLLPRAVSRAASGGGVFGPLD